MQTITITFTIMIMTDIYVWFYVSLVRLLAIT